MTTETMIAAPAELGAEYQTDAAKRLRSMSREERSLLLYFETCHVDLAGRVDHRRMNSADFVIAKRWARAGFVRFGRIKFVDCNEQGAHWVELSESAFYAAHAERRARAARMMKARRFRRTGEQ